MNAPASVSATDVAIREIRMASARSRVEWAATCFVVAMACLVCSQSAHAAFGITDFDGELLTENGTAASQAASHPFLAKTSFSLNQAGTDPVFGFPLPDGTLRETVVDLPPGLVGNPTVVAQCTPGQLAGGMCPADSQVGRVFVDTPAAFVDEELFNMVPPDGAPAAFGFFAMDAVIVQLVARLRTGGDYGISIDTSEISQALPLLGAEVTLWGVPADPAHDPGRTAGPVTLPERAFLTAPGVCTPSGVGLVTTLRARSWEGESDVASFESHDVAPNEGTPLGPTGCEQVPFDPSIDFETSSSKPDSPTGLSVELRFPREGLEDPEGIAGAHLKRAEVVLPVGMSINPSSAHGLAACTDAQLGLDNASPVSCPSASKIGDATALSPLLAKFDANNRVMIGEDGKTLLDEVKGGIYVRSQASGDPASGEMFRVALVLENKERGILVKLGGQVRANPATGQLATVFDNNPQMPVDSIELDFKGGPRAPLALPAECGTHEIVSRLTSWSRPDEVVTLTDSFEVDCPGGGFSPDFTAGSLNPVGAAFSPFVAQIARDDREGYLSKVDIDMPKGLLAKLAGVALCPDAVAGDGTPGACPAGSRIGTATVAAGAGPYPFHLSGPVYLTGPYKGAPYGLSVQVPAKAGPFDLGMVKVRNALHVDPETAQASVVSDALPQIVKGVPVRLRSIDVDVDRPGFTVNPTSCSEKRIDATLTSTGGAVHNTGMRFQVGDCASLGFKPKLSMRLVGRKQMRSGGHPVLRATLKQGSRQANIRAAKVTLPPNLVLDSQNTSGSKVVCDYGASLRADCPAHTVIGKASLRTPLLNRPLAGPVYLVQGIKFGKTGNRIRTLPTLLVKLRGEVAINLRSQTDTDSRDRLVSRFPNVPDARAGRFDIQINGGRKGILVVTENRRGRISLCNRKQTALVETDGHNGKRADYPIRVKTSCKARKASRKSKRGK